MLGPSFSFDFIGRPVILGDEVESSIVEPTAFLYLAELVSSPGLSTIENSSNEAVLSRTGNVFAYFILVGIDNVGEVQYLFRGEVSQHLMGALLHKKVVFEGIGEARNVEKGEMPSVTTSDAILLDISCWSIIAMFPDKNTFSGSTQFL